MYVIVGIAWFGVRGEPFTLFQASATIGTLILLVVYALATIGAARLLFFSGRREVAAWEVVVPALALVLLGYTLFRNIVPYPEGAAGIYPAISAAWILVGVVWVLARPGTARTAGSRLTANDGLGPAITPPG
jgi:hypothetical protein